MKNLLMVAYYFPPHATVGAHRTAKFAKYLPDFGWNPVVLTAPAPAPNNCDAHLLEDVREVAETRPVRGLELSDRLPWRFRDFVGRWLLVVDQQLGWWPAAVRKGFELIARHSCSAVYSTSSPYTGHLVGWALHRSTRLPWIADFRDPWIQNYGVHFPTRWHRSLCMRLEAGIVRKATRVIVTSERTRGAFLSSYPALEPKSIVTIPNGFDPPDFRDTQPRKGPTNVFSLVYTGSFYGANHSIRPALSALRRVIATDRLPRHEIQLRIIGPANREASELIRSWNLSDVVEVVGYLPHREAIASQLGADALLLVVGEAPGTELIALAKTFEYLAARRPILALIPTGATEDLLQEAGEGIIVRPDRGEDIASAICELHARWKSGELRPTSSGAALGRYERRKLTADLAHLLDEAIQLQATGDSAAT
jgi:glycosyltransferase involved in cell wall biosynthesis